MSPYIVAIQLFRQYGYKATQRSCFNPPTESTETNRMGYYMSDKLVLIGCRYRTDSMQPEKNSLVGRGRTCVGPLLILQEDRTARPNGPTEQAQIKPCLMDVDIAVHGGGHFAH